MCRRNPIIVESLANYYDIHSQHPQLQNLCLIAWNHETLLPKKHHPGSVLAVMLSLTPGRVQIPNL